MPRRVRFHALPLLLYSAVTLLLYWPITRAPAATIPGGGDAHWFLWDLWWYARALFTLGRSPFTTDRIYFPLTDVPALAQTPFNEIVAAPALFALPLTLHYNLLIFLTFVLSGYGTYLLVAWLTRERALALAAGLIFAFCSYRNVRTLGHLSLLTTQWFPFFFLAGGLLWRKRTLAAAGVFGVMAALVALSSPYYIGIVLFPAALTAGALLLIRQPRALADRRLWLAGLVAAVIVSLFVVPAYRHYLAQDEEMYTLTAQMAEGAAEFSADLLSYVLPPSAHPLWARWTRSIFNNFSTPNGMETTLFVGLIPLALAIATFFLRRRLPRATLFWQVVFLLTLILSLGPVLHVAGRELAGGMPFALFAKIPGFYLIRIPSRFGIMAALAIVVLAALAAAELGKRWPAARRAPIWLGGALLITANMIWTIPFPSSSTEPPAYVALVQESDEEKALLSLPAGEFYGLEKPKDFLPEMARAMALQTIHDRPLISGYLARRPPRLHEPERTMPFVRRFFNQDRAMPFVDFPDVRPLPNGLWPDDVLFGNELLDDLDIGHAALDCWAFDDACRPAAVLLGQALGAPIYDQRRVQLYRVQPTHLSGTPTLLAMGALTAEGSAPSALDPWTLGWPLAQTRTFSVTTPLAGTWRVFAEVAVEGETSASAPVMLTARLGETVIPLQLRTIAPGGTLQATLPLAAGSHALTIECDAAMGEGCGGAWLANPSVRLLAADVSTEGALADFARGDEAYALLGATLITVAEDGSGAPLSTWLATRWRADEATAAIVAEGDDDETPALRVEVEGVGVLSRETLGEESVWSAEGGEFVDVVPLPLDPDAAPGGESGEVAAVRLSLIAPDDAPLALVNTTAPVADGSVVLAPGGGLSTQRYPLLMPGDALAEPLTLGAEGDARRFQLLAATVLEGADCSSRTLATLWNSGGPFAYDPDEDEQPVLFVHLTDAAGVNVGQADHPLGQRRQSLLGETILLDLSPLPVADEAGAPLPDATEVRVGLWLPETETRFLPADESGLDEGLRLRLGTLATLRAPGPSCTQQP